MQHPIRFAIILLILNGSLVFVPAAFSQQALKVTCNQLSFHSCIEQKGFQSLCSGEEPDYLLMAVAVNQDAGLTELNNIRELVRNEAILIKEKVRGIKKPAKMLRFVFDRVQVTFLKQYDLDAGFSEMFGTGKYNCLTATILYALLFDDLGIKHTIKFMPGHVYLIAYADEIPYIFETTDPTNGFVELNSTVQRNAIQSMRLMQFMASDNGGKKPAGDIFDRYYIKLNNTEMRGLVGYQYTNLAFRSILKKGYLTAYNQVTKSILLTPMDELFLLRDELLKQAILQANKTSVKRAGLLVTYYNSTEDENKKNQVADEFKQTAYYCLLSSFPSPDSLLPFYQTLNEGIDDEDMKKVLEDIYTTQYILYLNTEKDFDEMFEFLYAAYAGGNKRGYIKEMIQYNINTLTNNIPLNKQGVIMYDTLTDHYPALMEFDIYRYNRCKMLVYNAEEAFHLNNAAEGERLLDKFDDGEYIIKERENYCSPASAYSLAGSYYFKKGNIGKAKEALNKGLTYDPDNWELKKKLNELK